jgi:hypothetical protein
MFGMIPRQCRGLQEEAREEEAKANTALRRHYERRPPWFTDSISFDEWGFVALIGGLIAGHEGLPGRFRRNSFLRTTNVLAAWY